MTAQLCWASTTCLVTHQSAGVSGVAITSIFGILALYSSTGWHCGQGRGAGAGAGAHSQDLLEAIAETHGERVYVHIFAGKLKLAHRVVRADECLVAEVILETQARGWRCVVIASSAADT